MKALAAMLACRGARSVPAVMAVAPVKAAHRVGGQVGGGQPGQAGAA